MTSLLDVDDLSVSFKGRKADVLAVQQLSLSVSSGETLALIGESGCGKSTVARAIFGLLPSNAIITSGQIRFEGQQLRTLETKERRIMRGKEMGMVFQDSLASLNPIMRIGKQIVEAILCHQRVTKKEAKMRALNLLSLMEFSDPEACFMTYPFSLSGGMRQRIAIAIALANHPKLLIADEATTALDVITQRHILDLLKRIQNREEIALLLITHDLAVAFARADQIAVMEQGKLVEKGSREEVFFNPKHPYTKRLLRSL